MARRALIIRPDYDSLAGFANSAACITQSLRARGFEIARCEGPAATRAGILGAYDELTAGAAAEDAVVVYYVGHGGLTTNRRYTPGDQLPRHVQNLCPTDFGQTADDDFRGISTFELSLRTAALTRKTQNVTVILECCFAAQLVRGDAPAGAAAVAPRLTRVGLTRHLEELRAQGAGLAHLELTGNPHAVRIAAAGQTDGAYQLALPAPAELQAIGLDLPAGGWVSAMTFRLAELLAQVGDARVSWRSIAGELRARMVVQRPEIEGPILRVPFSLATADAAAIAVRMAGGEASEVIVEAGRLHGVSTGDVYDVVPAGSAPGDPATRIATLTIDEVAILQSRARRITWHAAPGLPANAVAIARSLAFERLAVRVVSDPAARAMVETVLQRSFRVRAATPDDREVLAELRVARGQLELHDALGPLFAPAPFPDRLRDAVQDLENLATERRLRALASAGGPDAEVAIDLVVVGPRGHRTIAGHGEALGLSDRIAVRFDNRMTAPVFANVFNIGMRRRIALLVPYAASGIKLAPAATGYAGTNISGSLEGFALYWPESLPRDQPRLDTVMVVLTRAPADLRVLENREHLGTPRELGTTLQQLLGQLATGRTRGGEHGPAELAIRWLDFRLFPIQASLDIGAVQVDASPAGSVPPRVAGEPSLRICLAGLAAAAGTRIDVLVCARSTQTPYRATTVLHDPPGELEVWRGVLVGPAEVYVWTSTAGGDPSTLAELLALRGITLPVATLRSPVGGPRAPLAPGASLQLAALARAALLGIAPDVATAFRGSFGGDEPAGGRYTAAHVSFEIAIDHPAG